jgi:pimeloyl-ACP methyl ester carboxylesterase
MTNPRKYGAAPYSVAVIHGGPGAPGEVAQVAKQLSSLCGVLEPMQTEATIEGQIKELHSLLQQNGKLPVVLAGYSWGALLSFLFAARFPDFVRSLILIASPPLKDSYVPAIMETRLNRLDINGRKLLYRLVETLKNSEGKDKDIALEQLGTFMEKADSFDPLPAGDDDEKLGCQAVIFQTIAGEINELRKNGSLLDSARSIQCPVLAIHGDYDPHPAEGVEKPLASQIENFRFIRLTDCGHKPWLERRARDKFFEILSESIAKAVGK